MFDEYNENIDISRNILEINLVYTHITQLRFMIVVRFEIVREDVYYVHR